MNILSHYIQFIVIYIHFFVDKMLNRYTYKYEIYDILTEYTYHKNIFNTILFQSH